AHVEAVIFDADGAGEFDSLFATMAERKAGALLVTADPSLARQATSIASLRARNPRICRFRHRPRMNLWEVVSASLGQGGRRCPLWVKSRHWKRPDHVRFTPKSGHWLCALGMQGVKQRFYSITLSACRRRLEGTGWPIVFAVFKLIMSSNRVGCSIGISAGIVPRKTLTAMLARIRYTPVKRGP